jgi:hypothetical protein
MGKGSSSVKNMAIMLIKKIRETINNSQPKKRIVLAMIPISCRVLLALFSYVYIEKKPPVNRRRVTPYSHSKDTVFPSRRVMRYFLAL